ncbi:hypothetical protein WA158_006337 [Blastocystis sp. Blastoise]
MNKDPEIIFVKTLCDEYNINIDLLDQNIVQCIDSGNQNKISDFMRSLDLSKIETLSLIEKNDQTDYLNAASIIISLFESKVKTDDSVYLWQGIKIYPLLSQIKPIELSKLVDNQGNNLFLEIYKITTTNIFENILSLEEQKVYIYIYSIILEQLPKLVPLYYNSSSFDGLIPAGMELSLSLSMHPLPYFVDISRTLFKSILLYIPRGYSDPNIGYTYILKLLSNEIQEGERGTFLLELFNYIPEYYYTNEFYTICFSVINHCETKSDYIKLLYNIIKNPLFKENKMIFFKFLSNSLISNEDYQITAGILAVLNTILVYKFIDSFLSSLFIKKTMCDDDCVSLFNVVYPSIQSYASSSNNSQLNEYINNTVLSSQSLFSSLLLFLIYFHIQFIYNSIYILYLQYLTSIQQTILKETQLNTIPQKTSLSSLYVNCVLYSTVTMSLVQDSTFLNDFILSLTSLFSPYFFQIMDLNNRGDIFLTTSSSSSSSINIYLNKIVSAFEDPLYIYGYIYLLSVLLKQIKTLSITVVIRIIFSLIPTDIFTSTILDNNRGYSSLLLSTSSPYHTLYQYIYILGIDGCQDSRGNIYSFAAELLLTCQSIYSNTSILPFEGKQSIIASLISLLSHGYPQGCLYTLRLLSPSENASIPAIIDMIRELVLAYRCIYIYSGQKGHIDIYINKDKQGNNENNRDSVGDSHEYTEETKNEIDQETSIFECHMQEEAEERKHVMDMNIKECIQYIMKTPIVSGNTNAENNVNDLNDNSEDMDPSSMKMTHSWELVRELSLYIKDIIISLYGSSYSPREIEEKKSDYIEYLRLYISLLLKTSHQGVLTNVSKALSKLMSTFVMLYQDSRDYFEIIADILSYPVILDMPLSRRSAGYTYLFSTFFQLTQDSTFVSLPFYISILLSWLNHSFYLSSETQLSSNENSVYVLYKNKISNYITTFNEDRYIQLQIHSLNILKVLFQNISYIQYTYIYIESLFIQLLPYLNHNRWAIRSAASSLFTVLFYKITANKLIRKGPEQTCTYRKPLFILKYIYPLLLQDIYTYIQKNNTNTILSLFYFFSHFYMHSITVIASSLFQQLYIAIYNYLQHKNYTVRLACAHALTCFICPEHIPVEIETILHLIKKIPVNSNSNLCCGYLQYIKQLLLYYSESPSSSLPSTLIQLYISIYIYINHRNNVYIYKEYLSGFSYLLSIYQQYNYNYITSNEDFLDSVLLSNNQQLYTNILENPLYIPFFDPLKQPKNHGEKKIKQISSYSIDCIMKLSCNIHENIQNPGQKSFLFMEIYEIVNYLVLYMYLDNDSLFALIHFSTIIIEDNRDYLSLYLSFLLNLYIYQYIYINHNNETGIITLINYIYNWINNHGYNVDSRDYLCFSKVMLLQSLFLSLSPDLKVPDVNIYIQQLNTYTQTEIPAVILYLKSYIETHPVEESFHRVLSIELTRLLSNFSSQYVLFSIFKYIQSVPTIYMKYYKDILQSYQDNDNISLRAYYNEILKYHHVDCSENYSYQMISHNFNSLFHDL